MARGLLALTLKSAADLPKHDRFGKQHPYCVVEFGKFKVRSKTVKDDGLNPVFNETLFFQLGGSTRDICITVLCERRLARDAELGRAVVSIDYVCQHGSDDVVLPLATQDGRQAGRLAVLLEVKLTTPAPANFGAQQTGVLPRSFSGASHANQSGLSCNSPLSSSSASSAQGLCSPASSFNQQQQPQQPNMKVPVLMQQVPATGLLERQALLQQAAAAGAPPDTAALQQQVAQLVQAQQQQAQLLHALLQQQAQLQAAQGSGSSSGGGGSGSGRRARSNPQPDRQRWASADTTAGSAAAAVALPLTRPTRTVADLFDSPAAAAAAASSSEATTSVSTDLDSLLGRGSSDGALVGAFGALGLSEASDELGAPRAPGSSAPGFERLQALIQAVLGSHAGSAGAASLGSTDDPSVCSVGGAAGAAAHAPWELGGFGFGGSAGALAAQAALAGDAPGSSSSAAAAAAAAPLGEPPNPFEAAALYAAAAAAASGDSTDAGVPAGYAAAAAAAAAAACSSGGGGGGSAKAGSGARSQAERSAAQLEGQIRLLALQLQERDKLLSQLHSSASDDGRQLQD